MAKGLELQLQYQSSNECSGLISFRIDWFNLLAVHRTLKSPPALQFESISSLVLGLLMVQLHICTWLLKKTHRFDYTDLCQQNDSVLFNTLSYHSFSSSEQVPFNFMAAVSICSDFWNPGKQSLSLFPFFPPFWMPWSYFFECWILSQLFHSPLSPSSRGFLGIWWLTPNPVVIFSTNNGNLGSLFCDVIQHILMHKPIDTASTSQEIHRMEKQILKTYLFQLPQPLKIKNWNSWTCP